MLGTVPRRLLAVAAREAQEWRSPALAAQLQNSFFWKPYSDWKASSSIENYYIRKRRKWPIKPYKTLWLENFAFQLAKRSFKQSVRKSNTNLLSELRSSFAEYEINPTSESYNLLVRVLIREQPSNWEEQLREILFQLENCGICGLRMSMFIDLIKFYGEKDMYDDAVKLFVEMPKYGCEPSLEVLKTLLLVLCRSDKGLNMVPGLLLESLEMKNIRIDESCFGILIRALCRKGMASNALQLLKHMAEEGYDVDQNVCSLTLATMCRQLNTDDDFDIAGVLEDMKLFGFEPRLNDYRNMIRCLVKRKKVNDALELMRQMKMKRTMPEIKCYNLVLHAFICDREFLKAEKIFDELLIMGCVPDIYTYTVYINGLVMQNRVDDAIQIVSSMNSLGCAPNFSIYATVLRALIEGGKSDTVPEFLTEIQQKCLHPNSHTYGLAAVATKIGAVGPSIATKTGIVPVTTTVH